MCRTLPEVLCNLTLMDLFLLCFIIGFALLFSQRLLALQSKSSPVTKFGGSRVLPSCCTLISLCHTTAHYVPRTRTPQDPRRVCVRGCFDSASQTDAVPPRPFLHLVSHRLQTQFPAVSGLAARFDFSVVTSCRRPQP